MKIEKVTKGALKLLFVDTPIVAAAALSSFDPVYAAIWAGATTFLNQMTPEQAEVFSEELLKGSLKEELLESVEFARATRITVEAASNTASRDKIRLLARLLKAAVNEDLIQDFDEYKELVRLAGDISPTEFLILTTMDIHKDHNRGIGPTLGAQPPSGLAADKESYERQQKRSEMREMVYVDIDSGKKRKLTDLERRWELAANSIKEAMNFSSDELNALMRRLVGKGCVFETPIIF